MTQYMPNLPSLRGIFSPFVLCFIRLCFALAMCLPAMAAPTKVVIPPWGVGANYNNPYFSRVLALVFAKTEATDGPVEIVVSTEKFSTVRFMTDLKNNTTLDLMWYATSKQREEELLPIKISLVKELNEYRVLLIRKEDQPAFSAVKSLNDLRKFTAGAGADWPSGDILRNNNMPLVTVNNISLLFPMLKAKRFDYISRSVFEIWYEQKVYEKDGLEIERSILLHGGVPIYFFVNKNNVALADRLRRGLDLAMADGSLDALFNASEEFKMGELQVHNPKRMKIELPMAW